MDRVDIVEAERQRHSSTVKMQSTLTAPLRRYAEYTSLTADLSDCDMFLCWSVKTYII